MTFSNNYLHMEDNTSTFNYFNSLKFVVFVRE